MGQMMVVPVATLPAVKAHALAKTMQPTVAEDAFGRVFPLSPMQPEDAYLGALLARESGAFDAFRRAARRSVQEVLTGPRPQPVLPPRRAEDDQSHEEAQRAGSSGPKFQDAREFCERFIPRVTEAGSDRDRIALVTLHRLALKRGLTGCPSLVMFCRAMQQLYTTEGGARGHGTVLTGRRMKTAGRAKA